MYLVVKSKLINFFNIYLFICIIHSKGARKFTLVEDEKGPLSHFCPKIIKQIVFWKLFVLCVVYQFELSFDYLSSIISYRPFLLIVMGNVFFCYGLLNIPIVGQYNEVIKHIVHKVT